ncbi:MAG: GDP-mannose 4,6-dehydratase [Planctomycetota bacterium]|nr:GDP-mannose 4,6-dehydratase [Planctomycetota bacterium]MDA1179569.1 GDP-mannose 4,6-dehydratase [Planctomycetota bacterium]
MKSTAIITGITGQDGSYLAEFLLRRGYEVHGIVRHTSTESYGRIEHLRHQVVLHKADLLDTGSIQSVVENVRPTEFYNLAAMSFVPVSWEQPILTSEVTGLGVLRALEAIRVVNPRIRFYQASSSEMYGEVVETPQSETTRFYPRSPYAVAKVFAHYMTVNYRESYNMFACSGILFNHESPRRGTDFVTRKITHAVARIKMGLQNELRLGNLDSMRDWGFAGDYVRAMWMMLQQESPRDYVIGTGDTTRIRDFVQMAFDYAGLDPQDHVVIDPRFYRPAEVNLLRANPDKAKRELGWEPEVDLRGLVAMMMEHDLELARIEKLTVGRAYERKAAAA